MCAFVFVFISFFCSFFLVLAFGGVFGPPVFKFLNKIYSVLGCMSLAFLSFPLSGLSISDPSAMSPYF